MRDPVLAASQPQMAEPTTFGPSRGQQTFEAYGQDLNGHEETDGGNEHFTNLLQRPYTSHARHTSYPIRTESPHSGHSDASHQNGILEPRIVPIEATAGPGRVRPALALMRARSDFGPQRQGSTAADATDDDEEGTTQIRHGWDNEYSSSEYLSFLHSVRYLDNA